MIKYDNDSLRELIDNWSDDQNNSNIIKLIEEADTSLVTDMGNLFEDLESFLEESNSEGTTSFYKNIDISNWNVYNSYISMDLVCNNVTNMSDIFYGANSFNQPLNSWNVFSVVNMGAMFYYAESFNQPLDNWNVYNSYISMDLVCNNVTDMSSMFNNTKSFNQPLNNWDVSKVTNMYSMFYNVKSFNQLLDNWNVSSVADMDYMFKDAKSFNQNLILWLTKNLDMQNYIKDHIKPIEASIYFKNVNNLSKKDKFELLKSYKQLKELDLIIDDLSNTDLNLKEL